MILVTDFIICVGVLIDSLILIGLYRIEIKRPPHKILILFWTFILFSIIHFYAALHDIDFVYMATFSLVNGVRMFLAPLLYIYIKSIFPSKHGLLKNNLLHFLPYGIYTLGYALPTAFNYFFNAGFNYLHIINQFLNQGLVQDVYCLFYFYLCLHLYFRIRKNMAQAYSTINQKDFLWIRNFIIGFLIVITVDLMLVLSMLIFDYEAFWLAYITVAFLVVSMMYLGFYGLTQSTIFLPEFLVYVTEKVKISFPQDAFELKQKLEDVLIKDKAYLQPDLTLRALAVSVNLSERKLSSLINDQMDTTFYDLINLYRVEEAKRKLKSAEYEMYSMEGIGSSCGFKSKSVFYRVFKKETGLTPSAFTKS